MAQQRWIDPYEGFEYVEESVQVSTAAQVDKLGICGLDPTVFGENVDPAFFIGLAIRAGIRSGISAEGNVNMLQSLVQHRPARLDEPLTVRGRITAVQPVPRGRTVDTDVWFEAAGGERVITARRRTLKPDGAGERGAGERPPPLLAAPERAEVLAEHRLTPELVCAYSEEGNSIHYDPAAARRAGFRAPLIGGGMGVHFLTAALLEGESGERLDLDIYFRRPIFWDDAFQVAMDPAGRAIGLVTRRDGALKVLTEARINPL